jgi:hypothetical protein
MRQYGFTVELEFISLLKVSEFAEDDLVIQESEPFNLMRNIPIGG